MTFDIGDAIPLSWAITLDGEATNATVVLTVTTPAGVASTPTVSNPSVGSYTASYTPSAAGTYVFRWVASGAVVAVDEGSFLVRAPQGAREYVTLPEIKAHLSVPADDDDDDDKLARVIRSASRAVERHCGRTFWRSTATTRTFHADSYSGVRVDDIATAAGLVVATDDDADGVFEQTWTVSTDFALEPVNALADGRPATQVVAVGDLRFPVAAARASVQVTAIFGWPAVPDEVREATLIKAARLFRRKDTPEGVAGGGDFGVVRISRWEDPDVVMLLAPFVRPGDAIGWGIG